MRHDQITEIVIGTAIDLHRKLGPGLLESVYRKILAYELRKKRFDVVEEQPVSVTWDDLLIDLGFRADLIVEECVVLELKSTEKTAAVHKKQLLTYLKLTELQVGMLLNFGQELLTDGLHRIVNGFEEGT